MGAAFIGVIIAAWYVNLWFLVQKLNHRIFYSLYGGKELFLGPWEVRLIDFAVSCVQTWYYFNQYQGVRICFSYVQKSY